MVENLKESDKDTLRIRISNSLKKFVKDLMEEKQINAPELSRQTKTNETLWKNFLEGRIVLPSSEAVVALADYAGTTLDEVVGRDIQAKTLQTTKEAVKEIPVFLAGISSKQLQSVMQVGEKAAKFMHKPSALTDPKKQQSFVERLGKPKPTNRSR